MKLKNQIARRRLRRKGPLGKAAALLTASLVALIGLSAGLEPHVILWRAFLAAVLIGVLVSFGLSVICAANNARN